VNLSLRYSGARGARPSRNPAGGAERRDAQISNFWLGFSHGWQGFSGYAAAD
jgi:hypothetical protein